MPSGHHNGRYPEARNKDRIYTPYRLAWLLRRLAGFIANIRYMTTREYANKPDSAQVLTRIMWNGPSSGRGAYVFDSATENASAFDPRLISPCRFPHIATGDILSGVVDAPRSEQRSGNLISFGAPEKKMLLRTRGPQFPNWFEILIGPEVAACPPIWEGRIFVSAKFKGFSQYAISGNSHSPPGLFLEQHPSHLSPVLGAPNF